MSKHNKKIEVKTVSMVAIKNKITELLAKEIEEGAVISSALTSDGVPYFYLLKNGAEYRFGGIVDYKHTYNNYYVTVTIFNFINIWRKYTACSSKGLYRVWDIGKNQRWCGRRSFW